MNHKELDVWNQAIDLAEAIYELTDEYPRNEIYGLVSQMRRDAVSIAANLAEGAGRRSTKEFVQFVYVARGSASELDTLLELSKRTQVAEMRNIASIQQQNTLVSKKLTSLAKSLLSKTEKL